jgi:hypothetical protein
VYSNCIPGENCDYNQDSASSSCRTSVVFLSKRWNINEVNNGTFA